MLLTMGISPCPNDVFIFAGVLLQAVEAEGLEFRIQFEDVETLNRLAQAGALDVAKISCANYLRIACDYELLGCGGALGRGVGPLLLTHPTDDGPRLGSAKGEQPRQGGAGPAQHSGPGEGACHFHPEEVVLVPGEFTTANFLLDFYLQRRVEKRFVPFDALYEELLSRPGAQGVVIHEKRFTYRKDGLALIQDLGEHWEARTGYAIPLGAIAARRQLALAARLEDVVRRSLEWSYAHYDAAFALCREHAQDLDPEVVKAHIDLYVNEYSLALGPDGEAAIDFFLEQQRLLAR